jgi:hypothetical protein
MQFAVTALFVALWAAFASVVQEPTAATQTGASRVALAAVTDPRNQPLLDVSADDFVIQEAGASREILSVRPADYPIVVLVDTGEAARADFPLIRKAIAQFLGRIGSRPIVLGTFGGEPKILSGFDDDRQTVLDRLYAVEPAAGAGSMLLQAAAAGAQALRTAGALFSAVVLVSAAADDTSRSVPAELTAAIIDSNAALHIIANRPGQASSDAAGPGKALRALAQQSRGEYTTIYSAASYQAALDRLADRMSAELMIEYLVPVGSKPNDVKVGIRLIGARVRGLGVAPR